MSLVKVGSKFYESRYNRPFGRAPWMQDSYLHYVPRRSRTNWNRLDLRQISSQAEGGAQVKRPRTRLRRVLRDGLEVGAFGTIFATFLSSLYMLA